MNAQHGNGASSVRTDLISHLERDTPHGFLPVYAVVGSDALLRDEGVQQLRVRVLGDSLADFNEDTLTVGEAPIERVLEAARTLPCFAPRRFVLLTRIHKLDAKGLAALATYVASPVRSTVLCVSGEKLDQRTSCAKAIVQSGGYFSVEPPRPHALAGWLVQRASARGLRLEPQAAQLLIDLIGGTDVGSLDMAMQKAALYAGGDGQQASLPITLSDVEETVAPTRVHSIFELTDAIGQRDLAHASLLLRQALDGGDNALLVLAMITRQIRQLIHLKALQKRDATEQMIIRDMGIRPFLLKPLIDQAARYQEHELYAALLAAGTADRTLKSSRLDHGIVLDGLLLHIMAA